MQAVCKASEPARDGLSTDPICPPKPPRYHSNSWQTSNILVEFEIWENRFPLAIIKRDAEASGAVTNVVNGNEE